MKDTATMWFDNYIAIKRFLPFDSVIPLWKITSHGNNPKEKERYLLKNAPYEGLKWKIIKYLSVREEQNQALIVFYIFGKKFLSP